MRTARRPGFTLIELLTVIAIIALLAAILFPVFGRVRESSRQANCMSNLHKIYQAVSQFHMDNGSYPPLLLDYAERQDGLPWQPGDPGPMAINQLKNSPLFVNKYITDVATFHCPDNTSTAGTDTTTATFPASTPLNGQTPSFGGFYNNLPASFIGKPIYYYKYDSYDISSFMLADGTRNAGAFQVVYSRNWSGASGKTDAPNQMKYNNPPNDHTVVTWCNYHSTQQGTNQCPVLLLSGTVKPRAVNQVYQSGWNIAP